MHLIGLHYSHRYLLPRIDLYLQTHNRPIPYLDFLASMWLSSMQDCRRLQELGASMACARYEDLKVAPRTVIQAILEHCGLPRLDPERLDRVLAADSQAGTVGVQMDAQEPARRLTDDDLSELDRLIRQADLPNAACSSAIRRFRSAASTGDWMYMSYAWHGLYPLRFSSRFLLPMRSLVAHSAHY